MRSNKNLRVLAVLAVVLVVAAIVGLATNPLIGAALAPILLAIAKIISAVGGCSSGEGEPPEGHDGPDPQPDEPDEPEPAR